MSTARSQTRWGEAVALLRGLPADCLVLADERVLRLHPRVARTLSKGPARVLRLRAGEATKSLHTVERAAIVAQHVTRHGTVVALGGGTIGDVATVFAHVLKRGVRLVHVPSTLLAAVDSSVGGKGAVNVGAVKNALGVFHDAAETWLCEELFATLAPAQLREGALEAWKMAVTLDEAVFRRWKAEPPSLPRLISTARALKEAVCAVDPLEQRGVRVVLNFGHTFGHVIESITGFSVRHGEAVGLGMLCALDVGVALGVTPRAVRDDVERALPNAPKARARLARVFRGVTSARLAALLRADKKTRDGAVQMVLLERPGHWLTSPVTEATWRRCVESWRA